MDVSQQSITRCVFSRSGRGERLCYKSGTPEKKPETPNRTAVAALYSEAKGLVSITFQLNAKLCTKPPGLPGGLFVS